MNKLIISFLGMHSYLQQFKSESLACAFVVTRCTTAGVYKYSRFAFSVAHAKPLYYLTTDALAIVSEMRLTLYSQKVKKEQGKIYNIHLCFRLFLVDLKGLGSIQRRFDLRL
jgi:hypothetical protein